ncbi:MAG: hypothetical protein Q7T03_03140 [Deltaproteobacteria bacterium]|nr:hypothetical protein [Deltaproteobacteria bacterium]
MSSPIYPHVAYIDGEKYFLKPLDQTPEGRPAHNLFAVVDTSGFTSFYLDNGTLKKAISDPQKNFGSNLKLIGNARFGKSPGRIGYFFAPDKTEPRGWVTANEYIDAPTDTTNPYFRILAIQQEGNKLFLSTAVEPNTPLSITLQTADGVQTRQLKADGILNEIMLTTVLTLTGKEEKITLSVTDDAGNKTEQVFAVQNGVVLLEEPWAKDRAEYLKMLAQFQAAGYTLTFKPGLYFSAGNSIKDMITQSFASRMVVSFSSAWWDAYQKKKGSCKERLFSIGKSPLALLKSDFEPRLFFDAKLNSDRIVQTNPLYVYFENFPGSNRIRLVDFLTGSILLDRSFTIPKDKDFLEWKKETVAAIDTANQLHSDVEMALQNWLETGRADHLDATAREATSSILKTDDGTVVFHSDENKNLAAQNWKPWQNLALQLGGKLGVTAFPDRGKLDATIGNTQGGVTFNPNLQEEPAHPILVEGNVNNIMIGKSLFAFMLENRLGQKATEKEPTLKTVAGNDRYNNHINLFYADEILIGVNIERGPNLKTDTLSSVYQPVAVDLSQWGLGELPPIFFEKIKSPIRNLGTYHLYSDYDDSRFSEIEPHLDSIRKKAEQVETDFGLKAGTAVHNIYLVNSETENASVRSQYPETIWIWSEMVQGIRRNQDPTYHEGVHVVDGTYGISKEGPFAEFFKKMRENTALMKSMEESNAIVKGFGGHSRDNPQEALASLLNSFTHFEEPSFRKKFADMPPQLRELMAEAYKTAALSIQAKLPEAPLVASLMHAAEILK